MFYTLKSTNVYRVPTVEDALRLREHLERTCHGELNSFKYTTKYIKVKGEVVDEYQELIKIANLDFDKNQFWLGV